MDKSAAEMIRQREARIRAASPRGFEGDTVALVGREHGASGEKRGRGRRAGGRRRCEPSATTKTGSRNSPGNLCLFLGRSSRRAVV